MSGLKKNNGNCPWTYNNVVVDELPADCEGFVYLITNLTNNRKYVGKKLARFKTNKATS